MAIALRVLFFFIVSAFFICCCNAFANGNAKGEQQVYIVYMGEVPQSDLALKDHHTNVLRSAVGSHHRASKALLHSYKRSFNGFVARLTEQEKNIIAEMEGVVSVFPNKRLNLHTTRSWDFVGLPENATQSTFASDVIVGMIDTGIWPESQSFNDSGYGPPPSKWKGTCHQNFTCNNKIIGARAYGSGGGISVDKLSPRDDNGHGTHTASTAAGNKVSHASLFGIAEGTARGGLPSARLAIYKACWSYGCDEADMLAAFDDAIADGVDIISISAGGHAALPYFQETISIGSFHAMKKGILTSNSAGNDGPDLASVSSVAPWSLSVAANSIDRKFVAGVKLGNGQTFQGVAVNTFQLNDTQYPLVWGGNIPSNTSSSSDSRGCYGQTVNTTLAKGTILLCDSSFGDGGVQSAAGAVGTILTKDTAFIDHAFEYILPATLLYQNDSDQVLNYINTTSKPTATIQKSIAIKDNSAPYVPEFSSRGPNTVTLDILKPDISAPGVDILAAWPEGGKLISEDRDDSRVAPYNIISGTSMSCPHATGAAAYVKSFHPNWSPAAIKSALMTTATVMSPANSPDAELAYGAGQINPIKAANPGLIYDIGEADYVNFLCGQGYDNQTLRKVVGDNNYACSKSSILPVWDLNYPSFTVYDDISGSTTRVFHRTVTNVGNPVSLYKAIVKTQDSSLLNIQVEPPVLFFTRVGQKLTFKVTVTANIMQNVVSGSLIWDDGFHQVRSPIVAHTLHYHQPLIFAF